MEEARLGNYQTALLLANQAKLEGREDARLIKCLNILLLPKITSLQEPDLYLALGIPRDASTQQILRQRKELYLLLHPDRNKNLTVVATMAYDAAWVGSSILLSSSKSRHDYDKRLLEAESGPPKTAGPSGRPKKTAGPSARPKKTTGRDEDISDKAKNNNSAIIAEDSTTNVTIAITVSLWPIVCLLVQGEAIEDQFSKLLPCFHTDTRIGIIGAGSSGLSAAYTLCKLGYMNVTVLEKHHSVRGKCENCINCRLVFLYNCSKWD
ncbi:acyl carrier protein-like protein [Tanacetum coccineum]